jgi:hypothetical protein
VWGGLLLGLAIHGYKYPWAHTVYDIYGPAARNWWAGRDLYAPHLRQWLEAPGVPASTTDYYRYCPLFAVGFTPFALLPDHLGNPLWKVFNCAFFAAGVWTAARRLLPADLNRAEMGLLFLLVLPTSLHSMYNGQANLVVVAAILFGLSAAARDRWNAAAGWLSLATLIKGYPLALGLLLVVLYPRRFALRYVAALALGLLLPFGTQWPRVVIAQTLSWIGHLRHSTLLMRERLRSFDNLLEVHHHPLAPKTFALVGLAAGAVVLALCWFQTRRTAEARTRLVSILLLFSVWVVLFGPATEACTYVVMAPAIAWALLDVFRRPSGWPSRCALVASLLLMGPAATDFFGPAVRLFANQHGSQSLGAVLFLVHLLAKMMRQPRPDTGLDPAHTERTVWAGSVVVFEEERPFLSPPILPRPFGAAGWASSVESVPEETTASSPPLRLRS